MEDSSSDVSKPERQSNAHSFLPSRLSSVQRMNEPSQFQAQVLDEKDALVVVRFFAEVCPSCRATGPLFRKWSRDIEADDIKSSVQAGMMLGSQQEDALSIKILEMPLNGATSSFLKDELQVEKLPYCHVYHPEFGLVEEQLVMDRIEFEDFVNVVDCWSKGGCEADLEGNEQSNYAEIEFESQDDDDCEEFC